MKAWATREGVQRRGSRFGKTTLHALLTNVAYCGRVRFEGKLFDGEHQRIPDDDLFDQVQERLHRNGSKGERKVRNKHGALLKGLVQCGSCGGAMIHTYVQKKKARYRYYVCAIAQQRGWNKCETRSVSAAEIQTALLRFDPLWEQLTTAEQESFIRTLVQEVKYDGATAEVTIGFHNNGIKQLCSPKIGVK
ncbi:MAG: recombinase zinc beta ribbon domain-containing protein [Bryobacteraceae bacterium]